MVGVGLELEGQVEWFSWTVGTQMQFCPGNSYRVMRAVVICLFVFKRNEISEVPMTKNI